MLEIPFNSDPSNTFAVLLGNGVKYRFETKYNYRAGFWTFDLWTDADGVKLLSGVPILLGQDMLAPYALRMGRLIPVDESKADVEAGPDDLGDRVKVYWFAVGELEAAAAGA